VYGTGVVWPLKSHISAHSGLRRRQRRIDLRCPARRYGRFVSGGLRDSERVLDHVATPRKSIPSHLVWADNLDYDVVSAGRGIAGHCEAVDNVALESVCSFEF
jgi:hypothetical protein